jgi:hypothetical protein
LKFVVRFTVKSRSGLLLKFRTRFIAAFLSRAVARLGENGRAMWSNVLLVRGAMYDRCGIAADGRAPMKAPGLVGLVA